MQNYLKRRNESNMFDDSSWLKDFFQNPFFKQESALKTDIVENDKSYTLIMDIPGCNKEDVKISSEDGYLTIEANRSNETEHSLGNYLKRERTHGTYSRSYYIGNNIDSKQIQATFVNGVLNISFPKEKQSRSTTYIPIK